MAELNEFISPKFEAQVNKLLVDFEKLSGNLLTIAGNLDKMNKTLRESEQTQANYSKALVEVEKQKQAIIKTDIELAKKEQQLQKAAQEEIKTQTLKNRESEKAAKNAQNNAKNAEKEASAYNKLNKEYKDSLQKTRDLSTQYGANSKAARESAKETNKLAKEINEVNKATNQKPGGSNVGRYFKDILQAAGVMVGLNAVFNAIKNGIQQIAAFEKALSSLSAITGTTGKDLQYFSKAAIETSKKTLQSATEIVKAYEKVGSASPELLKNKEALAAVTEQAIILSEATGGELGLDGAIAAVTASMNQFGIRGNEAYRIVNVLAAGSLEGSAGIESISESMKNVGTVAKASNMSLEETVAALEVLGEKQLFGTEAGTKLRGVLLKLKDAGLGYASGTFKLSDAIDEANANLSKMGTQLQKDAYAAKIFGAENITAGNIILQNKDKYEQLTTAVTGTTTALDQQRKQNDNLSGDLKKLSNSWDSFVLSINEGTNSITRSLRFVIGAIQSVFDTINDETILERYGLTKRLFQDSEKAGEGFIKLYQKLNEQVNLMILNNKTLADFDASITALTEAQGKFSNSTDVGKAKIKLYAEMIEKLKMAKESLIITQNKSKEAIIDEGKKVDEQTEKTKNLKDETKKREAIQTESITRIKADLTKDAKQISANIQYWLNKGFDLKEATKRAYSEGIKTVEFIKGGIDSQEKPDLLGVSDEDMAKRRAKILLEVKKLQEEIAKEKGFNIWDSILSLNEDQLDQLKGAGIEFGNTLYELRSNSINREMKLLDEKYEIEKEKAGNNQVAQTIAERKYDREKAKIERKQAINDRNQSLFNITITTAEHIAKAGLNPYLIAAYLALAAAQTAVVMSAVPGYDKGTESLPDGMVAVAEKRPEFITHKGKTWLQETPLITDKLKGAKVIGGEMTEKITKLAHETGRMYYDDHQQRDVNINFGFDNRGQAYVIRQELNKTTYCNRYK